MTRYRGGGGAGGRAALYPDRRPTRKPCWSLCQLLCTHNNIMYSSSPGVERDETWGEREGRRGRTKGRGEESGENRTIIVLFCYRFTPPKEEKRREDWMEKREFVRREKAEETRGEVEEERVERVLVPSDPPVVPVERAHVSPALEPQQRLPHTTPSGCLPWVRLLTLCCMVN